MNPNWCLYLALVHFRTDKGLRFKILWVISILALLKAKCFGCPEVFRFEAAGGGKLFS